MASQSVPFGGAVAVITYGVPGRGKSVDNLLSFPNALFIGDEAGLRPATHVAGFVPAHRMPTVSNIPAICQVIRQMKGRFDTIVVDDFSLISERTFAELEKRYGGFDLFRAIREQLLDFRAAVRESTSHVIVNAHERPPHVDKLSGVPIMGGPKLPGKMPEELPAAFDVILRTLPAPWASGQMSPGGGPISPLVSLGWQNIYYLGPAQETSYVTKDRLDVCWDSTPMALSEIFRAVGHQIPRLKEMPWQEGVVAWTANELVQRIWAGAQIPQLTEVLKSAADTMTTKHKAARAAVNWTIRDAIARALIYVQKQVRSARLYGV
jgi:hypothetical protein